MVGKMLRSRSHDHHAIELGKTQRQWASIVNVQISLVFNRRSLLSQYHYTDLSSLFCCLIEHPRIICDKAVNNNSSELE